MITRGAAHLPGLWICRSIQKKINEICSNYAVIYPQQKFLPHPSNQNLALVLKNGKVQPAAFGVFAAKPWLVHTAIALG